MKTLSLIAALPLAILFGTACKSSPDEPTPAPVSVTTIPGHGELPEDTTTKEAPKLMPAEAYMRTYLSLFGGLAPIDTQNALRGKDGSALFDTWNDYLLALGFPAYTLDIPRQQQTNAVMIAAFERLGIALCDRSLEHDLLGTPPAITSRLIFAFDPPTGTVDQTAFAAGFDVLHRTFLNYPVALAPTDRLARFFKLYSDTVTAHSAKDAGSSRFTPEQAGWAACCYGLIRHPEFHLY